MELFKKIYHLIPKSIRYRYFTSIINLVINFQWRERKISLGKENKEKTFYVIRYRFQGGIFGLMGYYIPKINYAIRNNYIPIIDMQNYKNMYLADDLIGKCNSFEYFFNQPCGYTLNNIQNSKNIILSDGGRISTKKNNLSGLIFDRDELLKWNSIFTKYITIKPQVMEHINRVHDSLFHEDDIILGVLSRGTDYINNKPHNHPVQPEFPDIEKKIDEFITKYNCNKVFLATEDKQIYNTFIKKYGDIIITNKHQLFENTSDKYLSDIKMNNEQELIQSGIEYLTTIMILTKCKYFIGGNCGGSQAVMYISNGFIDSYIFDLGLYE